MARRLSLIRHPECSTMSGGKAIEHLAKEGNRFLFNINPPMQNAKNCDFSFTGLQHIIDKLITHKEKEEGIEKGQILSSAADIAAAVQHATACHLAKRTHRAILFCKQKNLLSPANAVLVSFVLSPGSNSTLSSLLLPPRNLVDFVFRMNRSLCLIPDNMEQYRIKNNVELSGCRHSISMGHSYSLCREKIPGYISL